MGGNQKYPWNLLVFKYNDKQEMLIQIMASNIVYGV